MSTFSAVARILDEAVAGRVFPGCVVEIGRAGQPIASLVRGSLTYDDGSPAVTEKTIYDLASLTKVLATTVIANDLIASGRLQFNDRIRHWIPSWSGEERQAVTIQDLFEHCSGLPGHRPYWHAISGRAAFELAICGEPLAYLPRAQSIYSDPGFMLLGFALENAGGRPLDRAFDEWRSREIGRDVEVTFLPDASWRDRTAPTENAADGGQRRAEVHDENCDALGGVAAHAGLFGNAAAVGACARWWMRSPALSLFARKTTVPGSSRAIGWDTMLASSSCGTRMSASAVGHTGFTGTSLWIDPTRDLYVVFLSNRVHPTREGEGIQQVRRALHDAVVDAIPAA